MKSVAQNNIGTALTQGKDMLIGSKRSAPKVLLALLDSKATDDVNRPAKELKDAGVSAVAIGGSGADQDQLNIIAGKPENVVLAPSYSKLPLAMGPVIGKVNNSKIHFSSKQLIKFCARVFLTSYNVVFQ